MEIEIWRVSHQRGGSPRVPVIGTLPASGVDPNGTDSRGQTPLYLAMQFEQPEVVENSASGTTALYAAAAEIQKRGGGNGCE
ncbi:MAG: ankyrin repeat domain-containing protein [Acidobacteriota bacterium]|nr:ankyrin repeat domain-containing protein [Acidobacteriota bacterium]